MDEPKGRPWWKFHPKWYKKIGHSFDELLRILINNILT